MKRILILVLAYVIILATVITMGALAYHNYMDVSARGVALMLILPFTAAATVRFLVVSGIRWIMTGRTCGNGTNSFDEKELFRQECDKSAFLCCSTLSTALFILIA